MNLRCGASAPGVHLWRKWEPVEGIKRDYTSLMGLRIWRWSKIRRWSKSSNYLDKFGIYGLREETMVGCSERVGRIAKVFAFGIELTPEIASSKKLHTGGRLASLAPGTLVLANEDTRTAKLFWPFWAPIQTAKAILGTSVGYSGDLFRLPRLICPPPFLGFASSISETYPKISLRILEGEEICSNYLDDPETTYCSRSSRQVLSKHSN